MLGRLSVSFWGCGGMWWSEVVSKKKKGMTEGKKGVLRERGDR